MPQLDLRYIARSSDVIRSTTTMLAEIARSLVDRPERVSVQSVAGAEGTLFVLRVGTEDLGKVLGRQGRTARSIRVVVNAIAVRASQRFSLEIEPDKHVLH